MPDVRQLAVEISRCPQVPLAWDDKAHPCNKVVNCQRDSGLADFQRPEPWMGGLATAKVLFIASNPSISDDPSDKREAYPTMSTSDEEAGEFFTRRFDPDRQPVFATFNHPTEPNFLTVSIDGAYRNGVNKPKKPQETWTAIHNRAVELLGPNAHPHHDWALTEVVHCKSRNETGVKQAAAYCAEQWLERIVAATPARVIVALGGFGRDRFARQLEECPPAFGSGTGYRGMAPQQRMIRDSFVSTIGDQRRIVVFNFRNGSSYPQRLPEVFGDRFLSRLRRVALGEEPVPATTADLHEAT
jgi:uracil-DNA glycosylase